MFFWDVTQRRLELSYRRFGITFRLHLLQGSSFNAEDGKDKFVPKRRYQTTNIRRITSQNSEYLYSVMKSEGCFTDQNASAYVVRLTQWNRFATRRVSSAKSRAKGNSVPLQAWTGPEAPRFQDNWHMKVISLSAVPTGRFYPPGNIPGTHFC